MPHYIPKNTPTKNTIADAPYSATYIVLDSLQIRMRPGQQLQKTVSQYVEKPDCDVRKLNSLLSIKWSPEAGTPS